MLNMESAASPCEAGNTVGSCGCLPCAQSRAAAQPAALDGLRMLASLGFAVQSARPRRPARAAGRVRAQADGHGGLHAEPEMELPDADLPEAAASPWQLGDAFPSGALACDWTIADYAVPLYDPLPCTSTDGSIAPTDLGFHLDVASTNTIKLTTGVYRMYFAYGKVSTVELAARYTALRRDSWPVEDGNGDVKFSSTSKLPLGLVDWTDARTWWNPDETEPTDCHFSPKYIGYLDSADGVTWSLTAPRLSPVSGTTCEDVSYLDAAPVFEAGTFWAGWHATAIPCAGAVVTYRDPSVVYLKGYGRYLMFVVRCDGTARSPKTAGTDVEYSVTPGDEACDTCAPSTCLSPTTTDGVPDATPQPTTDLVFFSCSDPGFQVGVSGPFRAVALSPKPESGKWVGVPQAFLTPDGDYVLVHAVTGGDGGLWVASLADLGPAVIDLERDWTMAPSTPYDARPAYAVAAFTLLGDVTLKCSSASTPTDPQFVFAPDGTLNLFFTHTEPTDVADMLRYVAQARAAAPYDATALAAFLSGILETAPEAPERLPMSTPSPLLAGWYVGPFGGLIAPWWITEALSSLPAAEEGRSRTVADMFLDMTVTDCPPIDVQEIIGADSYVDPIDTSMSQLASVHDPDVYIAAADTVQLLFSSFNGLIRAWAAPAAVWSAPLATC